MEAITVFLMEHVDPFLWGLAAFVIFVLILFKFAVKPVVAALDARERTIRDEVAASEQALATAHQLEAELRDKIAGAEQQMADMLAEARTRAAEQATTILEEGRADGERLRTRALRDIDTARAQAVADLRNQVAEIATLAAGRIIHRELDPAGHEELVLQAIDELDGRFGDARP